MFDEIVTEALETTEQVQEPETQEVIQEEKKTVSPTQSFRELREQKEKVQRERDEAYQLLRQLQEKSQNDTNEVDDITIGPDDIAEGKHISKVNKKVKELEKQLRQYQQQSAEMSTESRVMAQLPDFYNVVNEQSIDQLKNEFPEIAATLHSSTDQYSKAVSTYKLIKKLGLNTTNEYDHEKAQIAANVAKPKSVASISPQRGNSPLSQANAFQHGLTDELKKSLHKEMMDAIKGGN